MITKYHLIIVVYLAYLAYDYVMCKRLKKDFPEGFLGATILLMCVLLVSYMFDVAFIDLGRL